MWKLVGMAILLGTLMTARASEENPFYSNKREEDGGFDISETPTCVTKGERVAPEGTRPVNEGDDEVTGREEPPQRRSKKVSFRGHPKLKSNAMRSNADANFTDGWSIRACETVGPLAVLPYWCPAQQWSGVDRRQDPSVTRVATRPFSSWGGKRDLERYKTIAKIRRPVRVPFNSWGGKRNVELVNVLPPPLVNLKRDTLLNWGGKKTPPFNSWGGKRGSIVQRSDYHVSGRHPSIPDPPPVSENVEGAEDDYGSIVHLESAERVRHLRNFDDNEKVMKRISSRLLSHSDEVTTSNDILLAKDSPRVPFEAWGSKRRGQLRYSDDETRNGAFSLSYGEVGQLVPWAE